MASRHKWRALPFTMADVMCAICMAPLHDEIEPDVTALECGRAFHTYCLQTYLTASARGTMMELPCPNCERTGMSMSEQRSQAQRDSLIPGEAARLCMGIGDDHVPQTPTPPNAQPSPPAQPTKATDATTVATSELDRELDEIFSSPTFRDSLLAADEAAMIDQDSVRTQKIASAHARASPTLSAASTSASAPP